MSLSIGSPYVRAAIVGLGHRGIATLERLRHIPSLRITACVDPDEVSLHAASATAIKYGMTKPELFRDWSELNPQETATLLIICTPRHSHAAISIAAMERGFDVAVEVPAATTLEDCRKLIATVERTGRWFTMLENCCYDPFALLTKQMSADGMFGKITHCEGAYIHDLRNRPDFLDDMTRDRIANPYPTHGFGPMCELLGIGKTDNVVSLSSLSSTASSKTLINSTLFRTELGRTMLLQLDMTTPRPYSRLQTVCGTSGYISKYPVETLQSDTIGPEPLCGDALNEYLAHRSSPLLDLYRSEGERSGVENMMNYIMDRRTVDLYINREMPDITVNDAALWSSITPLSAISAQAGGFPVDMAGNIVMP